jgi:hypothetical protein
MQMLTDEGGLKAVLYFAQSDDKSAQRQVLQVLTIIRLQPNPAILSSGKNWIDFSKGEPFPLRQRRSLDSINYRGNQVDFEEQAFQEGLLTARG